MHKFMMKVAVLMSGLILSVSLAAQPYPNKPISLVVPQAAGGTNDIVARLIAPAFGDAIGGSVVVENRPGAGGNIGTQSVARSAKDGYTLLLGYAGTLSINPSLLDKVPFDSVKDFTPIGKIGDAILIIVANNDFPGKTLGDVISISKKDPNGLSYGTSGSGGTPHIAGELFKQKTGANLVHVPYKGGGPMTVALMSGEVQIAISNPGTLLQQVRAGRLRALAYNAPTRSPLLPNVPTMIEAGVTGMEFDSSWYGVFAPAKTPAAIVNRLHGEIRAALKVTAVRESLAAIGMEPVGNTPTEFKGFVEKSIKRYAEIVKIAGIQPE